jgi:hypothetical protein
VLRSGDGWMQRVLGQLGRLRLLTEGLNRFDTLPFPVQADLRAWLGWPMDKDEVLAATPPIGSGGLGVIGALRRPADPGLRRMDWQ